MHEYQAPNYPAPNYPTPNPNDLDVGLMMMCALALLILAALLWIDARFNRKKETERQAIDEAGEQVGAEACVHHDRCN
jgi:hypothetical protein